MKGAPDLMRTDVLLGMKRLLSFPDHTIVFLGWRSGIPWMCLCQLRTRSVAFNLVSGVRTHPPDFFQESSSKAWQGSAESLLAGSYPS